MGCGKTYLSRHVVQIVENLKSSNGGTENVAYCCLQDLINGYKTPQRVVGSLLYDILTARPEIASAMKLTSWLISDFNMPDVQKLWRSVITEAVRKNCRLTFIVDEIDQLGIDGCSLDEFIKMLACNDLPKNVRVKVRLLVLSRSEEQLEATLGSCNFSRYDITPEDTQQDIMKISFYNEEKQIEDQGSDNIAIRTKSADSSKAAYPSKAAYLSGAVDPFNTADVSKSTDSSKATDPSQATDPSEATDPSQATDPSEAADLSTRWYYFVGSQLYWEC